MEVNMKKTVSFLLVLCLALGIACSALAVGAPKITQQPVSVTTDKQGNVTLTFRGLDFAPNESSWHFIEPETGKEWTGPQLRDEMKTRKVRNFSLTASDGKQRLILSGVPKFMHGWEAYVVLCGGGFKIESDHIRIWYYGLDQTDTGDLPKSTGVATSIATGAPATEAQAAGTVPAGTAAGAAAEAEVPAGPKIITVTANKVTLYPVDSHGDAIEDQASSSLTFEDSGSVAVRSDAPVKYWMVNGIRIEPAEDLTGFVLKNITTDLKISAKLNTAPAAITDEVDPSNPCEVTCTGCLFTYHKGGLASVASGTVPAGATIIVFASDPRAAETGFSVNGDTPDHQGSTTFRLKITEDTTISVP